MRTAATPPPGRLYRIEQAKGWIFNIVVLLSMLPNLPAIRVLLESFKIYIYNAPTAAALAASYLAVAVPMQAYRRFPTVRYRYLSTPERLLAFSLVLIIFSVVAMKLMLVQFSPTPEALRSVVRLLAGPLTCLFFLGRWHRVAPWPFLLIMAFNLVVLILMQSGQKRTAIQLTLLLGRSEHNYGFAGIYGEPSHAYASFLLCIGGLAACMQLGKIRRKTFLLAMGVFAVLIAAGFSRTAYITTTLILAVYFVSRLLVRVRTGASNIYGTAVTGVVILVLTYAMVATASITFEYKGISTKDDYSYISRVERIGNTLSLLLGLTVPVNNYRERLETLDYFSSGRLTQAWIGYTQPLFDPLGASLGSAARYMFHLNLEHEAKNTYEGNPWDRRWSEGVGITSQLQTPSTWETARILSSALWIRIAISLRRYRKITTETMLSRVYAFRSYGALLAFYTGIPGWIALAFIFAAIAHPVSLNGFRLSPWPMSIGIAGALLVLTFSLPVLTSGWTLMAMYTFFARVGRHTPYARDAISIPAAFANQAPPAQPPAIANPPAPPWLGGAGLPAPRA